MLHCTYLKVSYLLAQPEASGQEFVEATDQRELGGLDDDLSAKGQHPRLKHGWLHLGQERPAERERERWTGGRSLVMLTQPTHLKLPRIGDTTTK